MSDQIRATLLREVHRFIAEAADHGLTRITRPSPVHGGTALGYPPADAHGDDHVLTDAEATALAGLAGSAAARSGLHKLLREAAAAPLFDLFCLLDGVTDPEDAGDDVWLGAELVSPPDEDREMLHDGLFESYGAFAEKARGVS